MSVTNYKCPACGAPISFNPKVGGFKCDFCFSQHTEEALTAYLEQLNGSNAEIQTESSSEEDIHQDTVKSYHCNNCGAEVVAGETSATAMCYYCHSPVVLTDRLKGNFKPDFLIPFEIDKKTAVKKFLEWAGNKKFVPSDFTSTMQQEKITGMYLPYWQADITAQVDYHAIGRKVTRWSSGQYDYTKTDRYQIDRTGTIELNNIQKFAFSKINELLINGLEPYDKKSLKEFSQGYLAGFFAEQYTEDKEKITPHILEQAKTSTSGIIESSTQCSSFDQQKDNTVYNVRDWRYLLLPSWILTYIYKGKTYVFAVNGQTGKSYGELPLNKAKALLVSLGIGITAATISLLGGFFVW